MTGLKPHAALLSSPGMGHIIPIIELGKCMVRHHGFRVTIFLVNDEASTALVNSPTPDDNLDIVSFPLIDVSGIIGHDASIVAKLLTIMNQSLPFLRSAISSMKSLPQLLIVDLFGTDAFAIAEEFGMLGYVFNTSTARFLAVTVYTPIAPKEHIEEHVKEHKPLNIPGCNPLRFEDTVEAFEHGNHLEFTQLGISFSKADGILVNSWEDFESSTFEAFRNAELLGRAVKGPVYPIGPLVRRVGSEISTHPVMDWLDKQPAESVIYVSFGSGGTLSTKQMVELAWGLELSQQRFIWVVRPPSDSDRSVSYFTIGRDSDSDLDYLPDGFVTRTRDIGLVVPMWAPQAHILSHTSIGGFLSHCGWNSTMESIINGVPMIAWPLYAEQKLNAGMLTADVGVAIRPKQSPSESGVVGREEIEELVREIIVDEKGSAMRKKMKELKFSAEKALDKGGSSYNSLSQVAEVCVQNTKAHDLPLST